MRDGIFINFEGIDKSGKGTQIELLKQKLTDLSYDFIDSSEPTRDSEAGRRIWRILEKKEQAPTAEELQLLYSEDRAHHVRDFIEPAIAQTILVEDRYFFSTLAYGVAFGVDYELLKKANNGFPIPDLTFYIKISAQEAMRRLQLENEKAEYFEKEEKLQKIKEAYEIVIQDWPNVVIIDGERPPEEVAKDIWQRPIKK